MTGVATNDLLLIGLCAAVGFGIIWSMVPGKKKD